MPRLILIGGSNMADNPIGFRPLRMIGGGPIPVQEFTLASNTSVAEGDPLYIDSNGQLALALNTTAQIFGVSAEKVTGATGVEPTLSFYPAIENLVFQGQFDSTVADTMIGSSYSIVGSTGAYELDSSDTDPGVAHVINYAVVDSKRESAGTNSDVEFVFRDSQFTGQS